MTFRRWRYQQWQMYQLFFIAYASAWQIADAASPDRIGIAIANLVGTSIALIALHIKDKDLSRGIEKWASVAIVWSMSCYLALALHYQGWWGVVHQPNLGIVLTEAVIVASVHRMIYTVVCKRIYARRVKKKAAEIVASPDPAAVVYKLADDTQQSTTSEDAPRRGGTESEA